MTPLEIIIKIKLLLIKVESFSPSAQAVYVLNGFRL